MRGMTSFSGVTIDPARFTADVAAGYVPFGQVRLTVGAFRCNWLGLDAGIELRTIGYFTEGARARQAAVRAGGPGGASRFNLTIGGGGGPADRNDFVFEAGMPFTLLFGDLVRFTAQPYLQVYSDKNCPNNDDLAQDPGLSMPGQGEQKACSATKRRRRHVDVAGRGLPACRRIRARASSARASCCRRCSRSRWRRT